MRVLKKVISTIMVIAMFLSIGVSSVCGCLFQASADDYIAIYTKVDLNNIRSNLYGNYKLMNDIVFTEEDFRQGGAFYNFGKGWIPIGDAYTSFCGSFNGNGYSIKGLEIYGESYETIGLFGCNAGIIQNVNMIDGEIIVALESGANSVFVGALCGLNNQGVIFKCVNNGCDIAVYGDATGNNLYAGGIAGATFGDGELVAGNILSCENRGSIAVLSTYEYVCAGGITGSAELCGISNCYNYGVLDISSDYSGYVGGIVGESFGSSLFESQNNGLIVTSSVYYECVGGIAGLFTRNNNAVYASYIDLCSNFGDITSYTQASGENYLDIGGIAGFNSMTVSRSYNTGSILGYGYSQTAAFTAGVVGLNSGEIYSCYNVGNINSVGEVSDAGGIAGCCGTPGVIGFCYNIGYVSSRNYDGSVADSCGGIVGFGDVNSNDIVACYYLNNVSYGVGVGYGTTQKCSDNNMKNQSTFSQFDFSETWTMSGNANYSYPEIVGNNMQRYATEIIISSLPTKTTYFLGDRLDLAGGKVTVLYNYGGYETVSMTEDMIYGFDSSDIGTKSLALIYAGKISSFNVDVIQKSINSIDITTLPTKLEYTKYEDVLDVTGGKITVYYNDGSSVIVNLTSDMVSGFNNSIAGNQTLTVRYQGFADTYTVKIIAKTLTSINVSVTPSIKGYVINRDSLDLTGGKLKLNFNNGTYEEIALTSDMVSGFNNTVLGHCVLTVTYSGFTCQFAVEIIDSFLKGDFDFDRMITVTDALSALRIAAKLAEETSQAIQIGDIDGDGHVTVTDALAILRVAAKLVNEL